MAMVTVFIPSSNTRKRRKNNTGSKTVGLVRSIFLLILTAGCVVYICLIVYTLNYLPIHQPSMTSPQNLGELVDYFSRGVRMASLSFSSASWTNRTNRLLTLDDDGVVNYALENFSAYDWSVVMQGIMRPSEILQSARHRHQLEASLNQPIKNATAPTSSSSSSDLMLRTKAGTRAALDELDHKIFDTISYFLQGDGDDEFMPDDASNNNRGEHLDEENNENDKEDDYGGEDGNGDGEEYDESDEDEDDEPEGDEADDGTDDGTDDEDADLGEGRPKGPRDQRENKGRGGKSKNRHHRQDSLAVGDDVHDGGRGWFQKLVDVFGLRRHAKRPAGTNKSPRHGGSGGRIKADGKLPKEKPRRNESMAKTSKDELRPRKKSGSHRPPNAEKEANPRIGMSAHEVLEDVLNKVPACRLKNETLRIIVTGIASPSRRGHLNFEDLCKKLPTTEQIHKRYGPKPVIVGMDTCPKYRELLLPNHNKGIGLRPLPRVAGLYHTGTNALARALHYNINQLRKFDRVYSPYDVPWGKHMPPEKLRLKNTIPYHHPDKDLRHRVLPIVIVRDPFFWMESMCKEWYDAKWEKPAGNRCPAIIEDETTMTPFRVLALYQQTEYEVLENFTSLPHMWNSWNRQYYDADYPRLIIRFEDMLYRMEEVMKSIRECVGLPTLWEFINEISSPKLHGKPTDFVPALIKHLSDEGRHHGMTEVDRRYTNDILDKDLMQTFGYHYAPLEVPEEDLEQPFHGYNLPRPGTNHWWLPGRDGGDLLLRRREYGDFDRLGLRLRYRERGRRRFSSPHEDRFGDLGYDGAMSQRDEVRQRLMERRKAFFDKLADRKRNNLPPRV